MTINSRTLEGFLKVLSENVSDKKQQLVARGWQKTCVFFSMNSRSFA